MENFSREEKIAAEIQTYQPSRTESFREILLEADLFSAGWLDSLLQLRLMLFLEKEFGVAISPFQLTMKNFRSVASIALLVESSLR